MDGIVDDSSVADGSKLSSSSARGPANQGNGIESLPNSTIMLSHSPGSISDTEPRLMNQKVKRRFADGSEPSGGLSTCGDEIKSLPNSTISLSHTPQSMSGTEPRSMNQKVKRRCPDNEESFRETKTHSKFDVGEVSRTHIGGVYLGDQFSHHRVAATSGFSFHWTGVEYVATDQRRKYIKQKSTPSAPEQSDCYIPRVQISDQDVTRRLIKIAQQFSFLDHFFADCFQAFEDASNHAKIRQDLSGIRNDLAKCQSQSSGLNGKNQSVYIGSLGEFCENVCASWAEPASGRMIKPYKNGLKYGEEYLVYLRDTLEVPYWQLVIDLLLDWRESITSNTLGTAILYMLQYKVISCRKKVEELAQMAVPNEEDRRELTILERSIQKRLDVLNKAVEVVMLDEDSDFKATAISGVSNTDPEDEFGTCTARLPTKRVRDYNFLPVSGLRTIFRFIANINQNASLQLALFVLFIICAFIPGYQGFAISAQSHENGTTSDSDFYYLIQSSIMSVLGNFATALPLLQSGRFSGPSHFFWVFSALGLFSAVLSVVIYPLTNTGWSSVVSFGGNVASAASVLVLTIATAREQWCSRGEHCTKENADMDEKKNL